MVYFTPIYFVLELVYLDGFVILFWSTSIGKRKELLWVSFYIRLSNYHIGSQWWRWRRWSFFFESTKTISYSVLDIGIYNNAKLFIHAYLLHLFNWYHEQKVWIFCKTILEFISNNLKAKEAGHLMSFVYGLSILFSPFVGWFINKYGMICWLMSLGGLLYSGWWKSNWINL